MCIGLCIPNVKVYLHLGPGEKGGRRPSRTAKHLQGRERGKKKKERKSTLKRRRKGKYVLVALWREEEPTKGKL